MKSILEINKIRADFPIFSFVPDLIYLDSAATSLKPRVVIESLNEYYEKYSANVFRGLYPLSEKATTRYEQARQTIADFIGAKAREEIIFTRGATEALNLICYSWGKTFLKANDEIVISIAEHHANFVPWQQMAMARKVNFKILGLEDRLEEVVTPKTRLLAINYVSNVLGVINPIKQLIKQARAINPQIVVVVDAAQAVHSLKPKVEDLDCDFLVFSGHKLLGPTGIGVLWGKLALLETMPPFQYGGEMISSVSIKQTTFASLPHKFEAGTPHIAGAIGLEAAIKYLSQFDFSAILKHEQDLWQKAYDVLSANPRIRILGTDYFRERTGILSFSHNQIHSHDLAQLLAQENICVRAGHHCAMPLHQALKINDSLRLSIYLYNTENEIQAFLTAIEKAEFLFSKNRVKISR